MKHIKMISLLAAALLWCSPAHAANTLQCQQNNISYIGQTGAAYTGSATGLVTGVPSGYDTDALEAQGCVTSDQPPLAINNSASRTITGTLTVAQVNAGKVVLPDIAGRTYHVTSFDLVATGTPATCTGIYIEDDNASPAIAATVLVAALTSTAHALPLAANVNAGFSSAGLTLGNGVQIIVDGSACTTMTALAYSITYTLQ